MIRLPRSLHWRIALAYTALIFASLGIVSLYLVGFVARHLHQQPAEQPGQAGAPSE